MWHEKSNVTQMKKEKKKKKKKKQTKKEKKKKPNRCRYLNLIRERWPPDDSYRRGAEARKKGTANINR